MSLAATAGKVLAGCMLLHAVRHGREGACAPPPRAAAGRLAR